MLEDLVTEWLWADSEESKKLEQQIADIVEYNTYRNKLKTKKTRQDIKSDLYVIRDYFKKLDFWLYYNCHVYCVADIMDKMGMQGDSILSCFMWNCEIGENGFIPPTRKEYELLSKTFNLTEWRQYLSYDQLIKYKD